MEHSQASFCEDGTMDGGGDFNAILAIEERKGSATANIHSMMDFWDMVMDYALLNAGFEGSPFT